MAFKSPSKGSPSKSTPSAEDQPSKVGEPSPAEGKQADADTFKDFLNNHAKPGLLSFLHNAFHIKIESRQANFFFDRSHANLIPMIKNPTNMSHLSDLGKAHFGFEVDFHFTVGNAPAIAAERRRQQDALDTVKANPAIKFLLDTYGGKIMNCEILEAKKET